MACVVGLDVDVLVVVGNCRLVGFGPVSDTVSCEDPHNKMCSKFHAVDSPSDEIACMLVLLTLD